MTQELPDLLMYIEVMGCPTTCQHCWAVGRPYQPMPLEDIAWALHEVRRFCAAHDLTVDGYPMHEFAAHPHHILATAPFAEIPAPQVSRGWLR